MRHLLLPLALIAAPAVDAAPLAKRYAVILGVTVDAEGKLLDVQVSKVIDPASGSTDAVDVAVAPQWLEAARRWIAGREQPHEAKTYYTYVFYDPAQPDVVLSSR